LSSYCSHLSFSFSFFFFFIVLQFSDLSSRCLCVFFVLSLFYADLICCNLLFGPSSLQVVAAINFTSLDCCMYLEACI
jgi:hypothetical protein